MALSQNQQNAIRLIVILAIAGSGLIRWLIIRLQEQAAKRRAVQEAERRQTEAIRTGRNLEESRPQDPVTIRARMEAEAAARRQAQIEEFRRRQAERARQRAEAQQRTLPAPIPAPAAPRPAPQARPQPRPAPVRTAPKKRSSISRPLDEEAGTVHSLVARSEAPVASSAGGPAAGRIAAATVVQPRTPEEWRRAIVASMILSPGPAAGGQVDAWSPIF